MAQGRSTRIIPMIKWILTSRLSIKNSLCASVVVLIGQLYQVEADNTYSICVAWGEVSLNKIGIKVSPSIRPAWSRGRRSQTVGADCLTVCHPRDNTHSGARFLSTRLASRSTHQSYRGTSLTRNCFLLGPYSRPMPRAPWWS